MAKPKSRFVCQGCGHEAARWLGKCPDCGAWNSHQEEEAPPEGVRRKTASEPSQAPLPIGSVPFESWERVATGATELDRVLGGGLVPGSLVLLGGDPGIGKSSLLMQVTAHLARSAGRTLYVTGEESAQQVRMRAERLDSMADELYLVAESDMDQIEAHIRELKPRFVVVDSIQAVYDPSLGSSPATVGQVRGCCSRLTRIAKGSCISTFLVGHVTKEGAIAGPRVLEHMVDTVLYFEGDRFQSFRVLRGVKNRFGSTDEIGLFEMTGAGLRDVAGASELFLSQRSDDTSGSAVAAVIEGTRPVLVEVQALVSRSFLSSPRRSTTGVDYNRVCMFLAILEKRLGFRLSDRDVYANLAGGLRISEPALDLAVTVALASSYHDRAVRRDTVLTGEVGLAGEVRSVPMLDRRIREAERMGFHRVIVPGGTSQPTGVGCEVVPVWTLAEAIRASVTGREVDAGDPFAEP